MVIGKVSSSGQESPAYVPVSDSEQQEPSLAAAGSDLSCFTVLPSSPPGRVLLCSSSRARDLWLCYGCTPSIGASLGSDQCLKQLGHASPPSRSEQRVGWALGANLGHLSESLVAYCCLFTRAFLVFAFVFKICSKIKPYERWKVRSPRLPHSLFVYVLWEILCTLKHILHLSTFKFSFQLFHYFDGFST